MKGKYYKKIAYALVILLVVGSVATPAYARLDEMILTDQPYGVNRVQYQQKIQPTTQVSRGAAQVYRVRSGDTLWGLAERHGISVYELAAANGLNSESQLYVGQPLDLPGGGSITHTVRQGESVISISKQYGVRVEEVLRVNNINNPDFVRIGQTLTIPGKTGTSQTVQTTAAKQGNLPFLAMTWPTEGRISSPFGIRAGGRPHHGVDIAAPHGALIRTPQSGRVVFSGYYGTYGNTVIIDHGGGMRTLYAHCSTLMVASGQYVQANDPIARVGNTGRSFGPHLHWEVHYQGVPFDPVLCVELGTYA